MIILGYILAAWLLLSLPAALLVGAIFAGAGGDDYPHENIRETDK